ncbi:MAG: ABC transporter permease [Oscillospiraceae bacterium]|jgi:ABC-2 type transport system permease protein|nr:ABC transporter permease [Oscillospiraceae bacterium]
MKHTFILFGRQMRHFLRSPDTIITATVIPVGMMLLFVYVFGGAMKTSIGAGVSYVNYQLPGILLMAISSGISYTAVRLFTDIQKGMFARLRSMSIAKAAILWSNVLTTLVSGAISVIVIVLVALVMGFRSSAGLLAWLAAAGLLLLFTLALSWLAIIPGLTAKSVEGSYTFSYPLMFLPFLSSAFVPTATMPAALRMFAEHQPVTSIVEAVRGLLNGQPAEREIWIALAWCVGLAVTAYALARRIYKRFS